MIQITSQKINIDSVLAAVADCDCGAHVLFTGTTRRMTRHVVDGQSLDRQTVTLEYECYETMAEAKIRELCDQSKQKWPVQKIAVVHRTGTVDVGETSIAVAVSSAHRMDAFQAAAWLVDELKQQVPIWKREVWADGTCQWVHPTEGELTPDGNSATKKESLISQARSS